MDHFIGFKALDKVAKLSKKRKGTKSRSTVATKQNKSGNSILFRPKSPNFNEKTDSVYAHGNDIRAYFQ